MGRVDVGFTGTQEGMTAAQQRTFMGLLKAIARRHDECWLHHGDCIGADSDAHEIARDLGWKVELHPPDKSHKRAFKFAHVERETYPYLVRNQHIVEATTLLIATPAQEQEMLRSGTWSTVRRAWKLGRPIIIILPDGTVRKEVA